MYRKGLGPSNLSGLAENPDYKCPNEAELPVFIRQIHRCDVVPTHFNHTKHSFNAPLTKVSPQLVRKVPVTWDKLLAFLGITGSDNMYKHACICVHVSMYVCVYVCMYTYMYVDMYVCVSTLRSFPSGSYQMLPR